jgi:hypothetical protein
MLEHDAAVSFFGFASAYGPSLIDDIDLRDPNDSLCNWFQAMLRNALRRCMPCAAPESFNAIQRYFDSGFLRFFLETSGSAARTPASCASLASLSARRRCMFLRIEAAVCSTSAIARAPSSWAKRCRLARATVVGDGSADFLLTIFPDPNSQLNRPAQSWDRAGLPPFQYIRENDVNGSSKREVFSAYFSPHLVGLEFEGHFLTLGETRQTGPLDGAHMNEHIAPAVIRLDEAETFLAIEPLNCACRHFLSLPRNISRDHHAIPIQLVDVLGKGPAGAFKKAQRLIE